MKIKHICVLGVTLLMVSGCSVITRNPWTDLVDPSLNGWMKRNTTRSIDTDTITTTETGTTLEITTEENFDNTSTWEILSWTVLSWTVLSWSNIGTGS